MSEHSPCCSHRFAGTSEMLPQPFILSLLATFITAAPAARQSVEEEFPSTLTYSTPAHPALPLPIIPLPTNASSYLSPSSASAGSLSAATTIATSICTEDDNANCLRNCTIDCINSGRLRYQCTNCQCECGERYDFR